MPLRSADGVGLVLLSITQSAGRELVLVFDSLPATRTWSMPMPLASEFGHARAVSSAWRVRARSPLGEPASLNPVRSWLFELSARSRSKTGSRKDRRGCVRDAHARPQHTLVSHMGHTHLQERRSRRDDRALQQRMSRYQRNVADYLSVVPPQSMRLYCGRHDPRLDVHGLREVSEPHLCRPTASTGGLPHH